MIYLKTVVKSLFRTLHSFSVRVVGQSLQTSRDLAYKIRGNLRQSASNQSNHKEAFGAALRTTLWTTSATPRQMLE